MLWFLHLKNLMFWKKKIHRHKYISPILSWMTIFALICVSIFCSCLFFLFLLFFPCMTLLKYQSLFLFTDEMRWCEFYTKTHLSFTWHCEQSRWSILCPQRQCYYDAMAAMRQFYYQFFYYIFLHSAATGTVFVVHHCYWYSLST